MDNSRANAGGQAQGTESPIFSEAETKELLRLKSYFPFRHVFGVRYLDGSFEAFAQTTKRRANQLAREGHTVVILS